MKLPITASNASAVKATATLDGSVVATIPVDMDDCVPTTDWNLDALTAPCSTRVVPFFGALQQRYLNLDFGGPFDSWSDHDTGRQCITGHSPSRFYLDGEVFGGTIGGDTGEGSLSEPPTDTLPGYEVAAPCPCIAPQRPCGGKEVSLAIARFLADIDDDGDNDQVLDVVPSGPGDERVRLHLHDLLGPAGPTGRGDPAVGLRRGRGWS